MILCCGEALIDMIPTPTTGGAAGFVPHAGGAIFNTAIALGRLGQRTGMLSGISRDLFGQQLIAGLTESGVDTALVARSDRPTTLAFVELKDGHATYHFYDENSAGRMLQPADLAPVPDEVSALYLGGISLACEPAAETYADFLAQHRAGRAVMVDPNIRPAFIADVDRYRARLERVFGNSDIVKVSDEDLDWIYPDLSDGAAQVQRLLQSGPGVVIVTRGGEGATGYLRDGSEVTVPSRRVAVVDTVGAGDTFNAGVLARLSSLGVLSRDGIAALSRDDLRAALEHGAEVAAVTVSRAGANPPWASELAAG